MNPPNQNDLQPPSRLPESLSREGRNHQGPETYRSRPGRRRTFPIRLHQLLTDVETTGRDDIISWQPHGRAFKVRKTEEFVNTLLPQYFNQSKWSSFQRQLNLYSFQRISTGIDRGAYYHRFFLRGEPALVPQIPRTKVKGTRIRVPADCSNEPNFYLEPPINPPAAAPFPPSSLGLGQFLMGNTPSMLSSSSLKLPVRTMADTARLLPGAAADNERRNAAIIASSLGGGTGTNTATNPYVAQTLLANQLGLSTSAIANQWGLVASSAPTLSPTQQNRILAQLVAANGVRAPSLPNSLSSTVMQQENGIKSAIGEAHPLMNNMALLSAGRASLLSSAAALEPTPMNEDEAARDAPADEGDSKPAAVDRVSQEHAGGSNSNVEPSSLLLGDDPNVLLSKQQQKTRQDGDDGDSKPAASDEERGDGQQALGVAGKGAEGDGATDDNDKEEKTSNQSAVARASVPNPLEASGETAGAATSGEDANSESQKDAQALLRYLFD